MQLTLTNRLRLAALARAEDGGRVVGTYVIDKDGVIDLTALEDRGPPTRASDPASLGQIAGRFGDAADVSNLYVDTSERARRRFRRRSAPVSTEPQPVAAGSIPDEPDGGLDDADESPDEAARTAGIDDGDEISDDEISDDEISDDAAINLTEAEDAETTDAPIPADDPVAAGDRIEPDPPPRPPGGPDEPEMVIDLRDDLGPSSMQSAIMDFNNQESTVQPAKRDIESGIRYGHGVVAPEVVDIGKLFDEIDLAPDAPRGFLFKGTEQTQAVEADSPEASDSTPVPTDELTGAPAADEDRTKKACPMCGGEASMDFANRFLEIDFYSCGDCFHMWHFTADHTDD